MVEDQKITKEFIKENLINSQGKLIGKKTAKLNESNAQLYGILHDVNIFCGCGKEKKLISFIKGLSKTCGDRKCPYWINNTYSKVKETKIKNGTLQTSPSIINKSKKTKLERYGDENYINHDKALKTRKDNNNEYGNKHILEKTRKTKLERYGDEKYTNIALQNETKKNNGTLPSSLKVINKSRKTKALNGTFRTSEKVQNKIKQTKLDKYGDKNYNNAQRSIINIEDLNKEKILELFTKEELFDFDKFQKYFGISRSYAFGLYRNMNIEIPKKFMKNRSELTISSYINNCSINDRTVIKPLELDIYSKEHKMAIEYNGLMWHSYGISNYSMFNNVDKEDKNRHLNKTLLCEEKGIQLYHIFENEWLDETKKSIWISVLKDKQGLNTKIGARKCTIGYPSKEETRKFLNENHLQGFGLSPISIGLYYDTGDFYPELMSIMTFGKSRFNKNVEYELIRFCNKKGYSVQGGASRLLKAFEREYKPKSLISYANRRWSTGNLYRTIGFKFLRDVAPNYFYFLPKENILWSRNKFQKHKLSGLLEKFNKEDTESTNMFNNGYRRIWDSGNKVYIKEYYV